MKTSELLKILTINGVVFIQHGARHDKYRAPNGNIVIVPRHAKELPSGTANEILKQAGINRRI